MTSAHPRPSLRRKLVLSSAFAVAVALAAAAVLAQRALSRWVARHAADTLTTAARLMEPEIAPLLAHNAGVNELQPLAEVLGRRGGTRVTVIARDGRVLADSDQRSEAVLRMDNHAGRPEVRDALRGVTGVSFRRSDTLGTSMLYLAWPVTYEEGPVLGVLRVAVPATALEELRRELFQAVLWSLLLGGALACWLGWIQARRLAQPLSQLAVTAAAYAGGRTTAPVPISDVREIHELGQALQIMEGRVRDSLEVVAVERNQATAILNRLAEGVIAMDREGRLLLVNDAARRLLGLAPEAPAGESFFELVRQHELTALAAEGLKAPARASQPVRLLQPEERLLLVHTVPAPAESAGPHLVLVLQDITESEQYERLRKDFVANVSHELKSPLTSIRSLTETLLDGALQDAEHNRRFVELIDQDAARLTMLIDDLLALSEIESHAVPLRLATVPLRPLIESVAASLRPRAQGQRVSVAVDVAPDLAAEADPDRLRQVLFNLMENAIKYNHAGGRVRVAAQRVAEGLQLEVEDTGIGIPAKDQPRVFERFYRVDKARSRELGGTGLGLAIVKHIVEAHGGRVGLSSQPDRGTIFTVFLPTPR